MKLRYILIEMLNSVTKYFFTFELNYLGENGS